MLLGTTALIYNVKHTAGGYSMKQELGKLVYLDYSQISIVAGRNTRFELGDIDELATSIQDNGIREPLKVQLVDKKYELINGHRRMAAVEKLQTQSSLAGIASAKFKIPAIIRKEMSEEDLAAEMIMSNDGKPFLPLEEGMMLQRLFDKGETINEIAKRIGKSRSHVSDRLALVSSAPELQNAIKDGDISTSDAITIARKLDTPEKQAAFVEKVKTDGAGVVTKELKKGRLAKPQWDSAEEAFGDFQAATSHTEVESQEIKQFSVMQTLIESNPTYDLLYQFGRITGMSEMANLTPVDLANKLHERTTGKLGDFK